MSIRLLQSTGIALLLITGSFAQSVDELSKHYTGKVSWEPKNQALRFLSSGTIHFEKSDHKQSYWDVPEHVNEIIIGAGVRVTGAFHTRADCIIQGEDRKTSVVYGTPKQSWADDLGVKPYEYAQFQNRGGVLTVANLTALNPFSYFIRGWKQVCHAKNCNFNGLTITNPKACLFGLNGSGQLDLTIQNATIDVKAYGTISFKGTRRINGSTQPSTTYSTAP